MFCVSDWMSECECQNKEAQPVILVSIFVCIVMQTIFVNGGSADGGVTLFGVEEGDTQLKHVSSNTLRMQRALEYLPIVLLLLSCGGVAGGQVWGHYRAGQLGIEPECTIVLAQIA